MSDIGLPVFDEIIEMEELEPGCLVTHLVVHRNVEGVIYCCHSPLEHGPVHCTFCSTVGNRVYVSG